MGEPTRYCGYYMWGAGCDNPPPLGTVSYAPTLCHITQPNLERIMRTLTVITIMLVVMAGQPVTTMVTGAIMTIALIVGVCALCSDCDD